MSSGPPFEPRFKGLTLQTSRALGRGAFGEVFLVEGSSVPDDGTDPDDYLGDGRPSAFFALKRSSVGQLSEVGLEKAKEEAKLLQRLGEENECILRCFDCRVLGGPSPTLELLLEFAPLGDLNGRLRARKSGPEAALGGLPEAEVVAFSCDVAAGLAHIHSQRPKVLHRDIKPANVVLFPVMDGVPGVPRAKIADFGIAKILEADGTFAGAATVIGTPHYFSPEICRGDKYDERSDAWALGCVLYEMLCLHRPFHQAEGNIAVLALRVIEGKYDKEALQQQATKYNSRLISFLDGLLALEPDQRARAAEVLEPLCKLRAEVEGAAAYSAVSWWQSRDVPRGSPSQPGGAGGAGVGIAGVDRGRGDSDGGGEASPGDVVTLGPEDNWRYAREVSFEGATLGPPDPGDSPPTINALQEILLGGTLLPSPTWRRTGTLDPQLGGPAFGEPFGVDLSGGTRPPTGCASGAPDLGFLAASFAVVPPPPPGQAGLLESDSLDGTQRLPDEFDNGAEESPYAYDGPYGGGIKGGTADFASTEVLGASLAGGLTPGDPSDPWPSRLAWMGYGPGIGDGEADAGLACGCDPVGDRLGSAASAFSFGIPVPAGVTRSASGAVETPGAAEEEAQPAAQGPPLDEADIEVEVEGQGRWAGPRIFLRPLWGGGPDQAQNPSDGPVVFCFTPEAAAKDSQAKKPSTAPAPHGANSNYVAEAAHGNADPARGWFEVEPTPEGGNLRSHAQTQRRPATAGIFSLTAVD